MTVRVNVADVPLESLVNAEIVTGKGPKDANTFDDRDRVRSHSFDQVCIKDGIAHFEMPPLSMFAGTFKANI